MKNEPFTLETYSLYLDAAIRSRYRFINFNGIKEKDKLPDYPFVLLRHDIDYDPNWILPISRLEAEKGIQSTYFFQMNSRFYDFESMKTHSIIQEVLSHSHWLGLHFDANQAGDDKEVVDLIDSFAGELESRYNHSISAVSFHMPTYRPVKQIKLKNNRINTCSPVFFEEIEYISDSNMDWRGKDIYKIFHNMLFERIQLLIHPIWWRENYKSLNAKIEELSSKLGISINEILTKEQKALIYKKR